ncbi:CotH kinase family protein [Clostridium sp.]
MKNKKNITFLVVLVTLAVMLIGTTTLAGNTKTSVDVQATNIKTQPEYIEKVLNKDKITEINIDINKTDWDWLLKNASKKEPRSCNITVNGTTFYNVAINPKGNSSLTSIASDDTTDRFSLKLDFGAFVEGQTCFGLQKIALNNVMSDTSYMKEALSYDLFKYMGVATPAYSYANIKLNGKDWGLYTAVEIIEKSFVQRQFGTSKGNLYKPESMDMLGDNAADKEAQGGMNMGGMMGSGKGADLKYTGDSASNYSTVKEGAIFNTNSDKDFKKVIKMIEHLDSGSNLEKYLDVDEVLRYFAVNTFLVNLDSYSGGMYHNYYLYEKDGVFKIIPWDLNMSFAGMNMSDGTKAINFPIDMPVTGKLEDAPLIGKLLEVPKYKEIYHSYLKQISEKYINSGVYEDSIIKTDKLINSYVKKDATALYTYEEYSKATPMMVTFGLDRAKSIDAQLKGTQPSTTYGTISSKLNLSTLGGMEIGGKKMQGGAGNAAMPDMKNMQPIMKIVQEADGKELTAKQKESLKTLGVDDAMLKTIKSMGAGGGIPSMGNTGNQSIMQIGMIALSTVLLLLGLLFVFKFKRKRFRAK